MEDEEEGTDYDQADYVSVEIVVTVIDVVVIVVIGGVFVRCLFSNVVVFG